MSARYLKRDTTTGPIVLFDHREEGEGKKPFDLPWPMRRATLRTGDYTFKGCEKLVAIERKSGIMEMLKDLTVNYRQTFERFLQRLSNYSTKIIIVQEPLSIQTVQTNVDALQDHSQGKSRLTANTIWYWTAKISLYYGIPIIYTDSKTLIRRAFEAAWQQTQEIRCI